VKSRSNLSKRTASGLILAAVAVVAQRNAPARAGITFVTNWFPTGDVNVQSGMAISPSGTVYITEPAQNSVQMESPGGTPGVSFPILANPPGGSNGLAGDYGIAVGPNGNVYVDGPGSVEVYSPTGALQTTFPISNVSNNSFLNSIAVGPNGTVYTTDSVNSRIDMFSSSGSFQGDFPVPSVIDPAFVSAGPDGTVYTQTPSTGIDHFSAAGTFLGALGTVGLALVNTPTSVSVSPTGLLYVGGSSNELASLNSAGMVQTTFTASGPVIDVSAQPTGNIYALAGGSVYDYFDPASWVSGTNNFSLYHNSGGVQVGTNQLLGSALTLNPSMTLIAGPTLTVGNGTFTQAGGTLSYLQLILNAGGTFNYQSGLFPNAGITINSGGTFLADQGGALTTTFGPMAISGTMTLDGGVSFSADNVNVNSGGLLVLGNALFSAGSSVMNIAPGGEVQLANAISSGISTALSNNGLLDGSGRITGPFTNQSTGEVSVASGQSLTFTAQGDYNEGQINLTGGSIHFTQPLQNAGAIQGFGTFRADGGVDNTGIITIGGITSSLFGPITNAGSIALSGSTYVFGTFINVDAATLHLSGPNDIFYGAITNGGDLSVDPGASGLFYGPYAGDGPINNNGSLYINATFISGNITGNGVLTLGTSNSPVTAQIASGAQSQFSGLTISPGSSLDITSGSLAINFAPGADPSPAIRAYLASGYNGDTWTGAGIVSSVAAANPGLYAVGYADGNRDAGTPAGSNQIIIETTLAGDANLDGTVNFADLLVVAQNFNHAFDTHGNAIDWADGDFNYDGNVNFADLLLIAQNFNKTLSAGELEQLPGSFAAAWELALADVRSSQTNNVPEPGATGLISLSAATLLARRRKKLALE
jgi:hypothetical protein